MRRVYRHEGGLAAPVGVALYPFTTGVAPSVLYVVDPMQERVLRVLSERTDSLIIDLLTAPGLAC